ncbi:MAG TPA: serine hydrolase domain-containing protein [Caulobacteraceae bacterium]|nr:serine hydrolase domain-containing protein [Caulobacteraceae bacterium]
MFATSREQERAGMATSADFEGVVEPHYRAEGPGAAIAVRHRGEPIHVRGYGLANVEWRIPIDADTVFRIGSITKQFTAAAILKLSEAGALDIDDPIERHLTNYPVGDRRITIRHLLNHTSGIKSYPGLPEFWASLSNKDLPLPDMIDVFKDLPLDFEPGEKFQYNNSGYLLLGAIIERASGKDYAAFLRESFFAPLGLTSTYYLHDRPVTPKRAAGYERRGREVIRERRTHLFANDDHAIDHAGRIGHPHEIKLWQGERLVAHFPAWRRL